MIKDIINVINRCEICIKYDKIKLINNPATAMHVDNYFDKMSIDIKGGLHTTEDGNSSMLVVVEYLTKFALAFPLKHKSADEIAGHLTKLICTFGLPGCLLSNQGKKFLNLLVKKVCENFKIIKRTTSSYNPRTNGLCERTNQTLTQILTKHVQTTLHNGTKHLTSYSWLTEPAYTQAQGTPRMFGRRFGQFENWITKEKEIHKEAIEYRIAEIKVFR